MSVIEAIILGIVQGLTEFLPVSSSGHIELGKAFMDVKAADNLAFSVLVHGATVLSIIVVFWKDILHLIRSLFSFQWNEDTRYISLLAISAIPVAVVGLLFEDQIEALFSGKVVMVGVLLIVTGCLLFLTRLERGQNHKVGFKSAVIVGLAQAAAILPGISRSGATISTALALGISREQATRFSFLMVLAPILGATVLQFKDLTQSTSAHEAALMPYLAGFIAAFLSGLLACKWMISLVNKGKIIYFSIYCFLIGIAAIVIGSMG